MPEKITQPENSVLYVALSTTGENKIPGVMARKLKAENPTAEIVEDYARARQITQSAHKNGLEKLRDPVKWDIHLGIFISSYSGNSRSAGPESGKRRFRTPLIK